VDEEVLAGRPPGARGRESPAGTEIMPVRMVVPFAGPGLQHPHHPDPAAAEPWVQRPFLEGRCRAPQEEVVEGLLVVTCQRSACIRERQGHQEVRHRQEETLVVFQPWLGLVMLALGTVPVLTGVVAVMVRLAGLTMLDLAAAGLRAAPRDVLPGPQMTGKPPVAKCRAVGGAMEAEHRSALHHHRSPLRRVMASAPRGSALAGRCV
jgi:hypothetical protein